MRHVVLCLLLMFSIPTFANEADRLTQANFPAQSQQLALKNQAVLTYLWADVYAAAFYAEPRIAPDKAFNDKLNQRLRRRANQGLAMGTPLRKGAVASRRAGRECACNGPPRCG